MADAQDQRLKEAQGVLDDLLLPRPQRNVRTALCLLALMNLTPHKSWRRAEAPLMGITPIMSWARSHYGRNYAPNTRETFRRQSMHQFIEAGIAVGNPDQPRSINSPATVYQIEPGMLSVLRTFGTKTYAKNLAVWLGEHKTLVARYANEREMRLVPVQMPDGELVSLSPGPHSKLIKDIIGLFAPRFAPGCQVVYVGDTGDKWGYVDRNLLSSLNIELDEHGKMPDVLIYYPERNWLLLIEAVTSHGPVDGKRHDELARLFSPGTAGLVYVSAFPSRRVMNRYLDVISWETEVWVADAPSHLIHFNGARFLGPHISPEESGS